MAERLFFALWPGNTQRLALVRVQSELVSPTTPSDWNASPLGRTNSSPNRGRAPPAVSEAIFEPNLGTATSSDWGEAYTGKQLSILSAGTEDLAPRQAHLARGGFRGRLIHPDDIHLTLVFLGAISPDQRRCAEAAAMRVRSPAFALRLDRVGSFPQARVIWCGTDPAPAPLTQLVATLHHELRDCGLALDSRPYAPHATLARNARPLLARPLVKPIHWPVEAFVLAYGIEGPPPRYRILRHWHLGRPQA